MVLISWLALYVLVVARSPQGQWREVAVVVLLPRLLPLVVRISIAAAVVSVRSVSRSRTGLIVLWAGYRWRMLLAGEGIERWSQSFVLSPVWMVLQNLILEGNFAFMEY